MAIKSFFPAFLYKGIYAETIIVINAPTAGAALNIPKPSDPTFKISCAKTGSNATAPPKSTAIISSDKAPKTIWFLNTKFKPSVRLSFIDSPIFGLMIGFALICDKAIKERIENPKTKHIDQ